MTPTSAKGALSSMVAQNSDGHAADASHGDASRAIREANPEPFHASPALLGTRMIYGGIKSEKRAEALEHWRAKAHHPHQHCSDERRFDAYKAEASARAYFIARWDPTTDELRYINSVARPNRNPALPAGAQ